MLLASSGGSGGSIFSGRSLPLGVSPACVAWDGRRALWLSAPLRGRQRAAPGWRGDGMPLALSPHLRPRLRSLASVGGLAVCGPAIRPHLPGGERRVAASAAEYRKGPGICTGVPHWARRLLHTLAPAPMDGGRTLDSIARPFL
eukprot:scaffold2232_cov365-Prasinococcus_capsulatus_cf.AAC.4